MCPGAPLLVAGLAPGLASAVPGLLESCRLAVASLAGADRILLLASGPRMRDLGARVARPTVVHPPGTLISSAGLTGSWPAHFAGRLSAGPALIATGAASTPNDGSTPGSGSTTAAGGAGVGVVVGVALLAAGRIDAPAVAIEVGDQGVSAAELYAAAGSSTDRIGVLVIGEGSAARGDDSPVGGHPAAAEFDRKLGRALAAGDPVALSAVVAARSGLADQLMFTAGPAFAALAALTADTAPDHADLLFDEAPFGVAYLVATWSFTATPGRRPNQTAVGGAG